MILHGLAPLVDNKTKVLILGSFPGPMSLEKQEYYANKQNEFWRIMADLLASGRLLSDYASKKLLLRESGVGVWDTVSSCERKGADDNNIRGAKPNDIGLLISQYPSICAVFFNGKRAFNDGKQTISVSIKVQYLPSTSPANRAIPYETKLKAWRAILKFLC